MFFTDGLLEDHLDDIDAGLEHLSHVLTSPGRPAEKTCEAVLNALLPGRSKDDVTLLVARTRTFDNERVVSWDLPSDPAVVSTMRAAITRQLADWDLDELAFATELMLNELISNAIRHATGPIRLRMLRTHSLICEVSDASSTSPTCAAQPPPTKADAACSSSPNSPNVGAPATPPTAKLSGLNKTSRPRLCDLQQPSRSCGWVCQSNGSF